MMMKQWLSLFPCLSFCHDQVLMRRSGKQWSWWRCGWIECMHDVIHSTTGKNGWGLMKCDESVHVEVMLMMIAMSGMNVREWMRGNCIFSFGILFVNPSPWAKSITPLSYLHELLSSRKRRFSSKVESCFSSKVESCHSTSNSGNTSSGICPIRCSWTTLITGSICSCWWWWCWSPG